MKRNVILLIAAALMVAMVSTAGYYGGKKTATDTSPTSQVRAAKDLGQPPYGDSPVFAQCCAVSGDWPLTAETKKGNRSSLCCSNSGFCYKLKRGHQYDAPAF